MAEIRVTAALSLDCSAADIAIAAAPGWREWFASGCGKRLRFECASRYACCPFVGASEIGAEAPGVDPVGVYDAHTLQEAKLLVGACYEAARDPSRLGQRVGTNAGVISLVVTIAETGSVQDVSLLRTSIGQPDYETCAQKVLRRASFAPSGTGAPRRVIANYILVERQVQSAVCAPNPTIVPWRK